MGPDGAEGRLTPYRVRMRTTAIFAVALVALGFLLLLLLEPIRRAAVVYLSDDYAVNTTPAKGATFDGLDAQRRPLAVTLKERAAGFEQPTELAFVPGQPDLMVVLERTGTAWWIDLAGEARKEWFSVDVLTASEQGLLGLAFHPGFADNGRFFVNYVARREGAATTVVQEWRIPAGSTPRTATPVAHATVLQVPQPYANHNGGQLLFGPDGMLYVPLGDGGLKDDVHGNAQNRGTLLGSILRLDVDKPAPHVPADNPFVGIAGVRPEIWAYGVRNPWRSSFAPGGRLIVADVGQNLWEEVGFARAGASLGWRTWEGRHCFPPGQECEAGEHIQPFWEYAHPEGQSITGGRVYEGAAIPDLLGRYVVADFVSGRLWAVPVPAEGDGPVDEAEVRALGRWDLLPSSFAADPAGELWVTDYGRGRILQLVPATP